MEDYQRGHVGERRRIQNLADARAFMLMHEAEPEQLLLRAAAGVVFHRQRDELNRVITAKTAMMMGRQFQQAEDVPGKNEPM